MVRYIIKRILWLIPVALGVTVLVFSLLYFTPGDPASFILGSEASEEDLAAKREELGLNDSYFVRLGRYIRQVVVEGDLGRSYTTNKKVSDEIRARFPNTFTVAIVTVIFAAVVGIPLGVITAVKKGSWLDNTLTVVSLAFVSMPGFWLGLMLSLVFALKLHWLPATGSYGLKYYILPCFSIAAHTIGTVTRMTRSSMLDVLSQDYITTARAKGQSELNIIIKHALSNSLIPTITVLGNSVGRSVGGAIVTEAVFAIPGLGSMMIAAIRTRDFPSLQGAVLVSAVACAIINLIVDILYAYADPRIKAQYAGKKKKAGGQA